MLPCRRDAEIVTRESLPSVIVTVVANRLCRAEYSQDGGSVHAEPCRTGEIRERRIVNTGDVKRVQW